MLTVSNKNSLYDDTWNGYVCLRHLVVSTWIGLGFIEIDGVITIYPKALRWILDEYDCGVGEINM